MSLNSRRSTIIVSAIIVIIGVAAYLNHWQRVKAFNPAKLTATYFEQPRIVSDFVLQDQDGKPFTNDKLQGHWSILFFGFTNCGYICPTTMAMLGQTVEMMQQAHVRQLPEVVFVSVDPERDSIAEVKKYVQSFNPNFKGVRGDKAAVKQLAKEMAVVYLRAAKDADKKNYDINHSGTLMLINPKGQLQAIFSPPHKPETLAKDFAMIASHVR